MWVLGADKKQGVGVVLSKDWLAQWVSFRRGQPAKDGRRAGGYWGCEQEQGWVSSGERTLGKAEMVLEPGPGHGPPLRWRASVDFQKEARHSKGS